MECRSFYSGFRELGRFGLARQVVATERLQQVDGICKADLIRLGIFCHDLRTTIPKFAFYRSHSYNVFIIRYPT